MKRERADPFNKLGSKSIMEFVVLLGEDVPHRRIEGESIVECTTAEVRTRSTHVPENDGVVGEYLVW